MTMFSRWMSLASAAALLVAAGCTRGEDDGGASEEATVEEAQAGATQAEDDDIGEEEPPPPPGHSMESIFASLDWNEDGMIDCGELRQSECFGNGGELFAEEVGYTAPLSPGACARNETCAALLGRGMEFDETLVTREELVEAFMELDSNDDGVVTCAEVPDAAVCSEEGEDFEIDFNDCIGDMGCQTQIPFDGWPGAEPEGGATDDEGAERAADSEDGAEELDEESAE